VPPWPRPKTATGFNKPAGGIQIKFKMKLNVKFHFKFYLIVTIQHRVMIFLSNLGDTVKTAADSDQWRMVIFGFNKIKRNYSLHSYFPYIIVQFIKSIYRVQDSVCTRIDHLRPLHGAICFSVTAFFTEHV